MGLYQQLITRHYGRDIFEATASCIRRFQMKWNNKKRQATSGRFASFFGIIALVAVIGLSMTACGSAPRAAPAEDITITVTGISGSEYAGWEANLSIDDNKNTAWVMPLSVNANTTTLTFSLLRMDNNKPFNKSGNYMVVLWFRKDGDKSTDKNFVLMSKNISGGSNTIAFDTFSKL
jgi:hypothetical protein